MLRMPSHHALKAMIEDALRFADPAGHDQARREGALDQVLDTRAQSALETYYRMMAEAEPRIECFSTLGDQLRETSAARRIAVEVAIAQATEFSCVDDPDESAT